MTKRKFANVEWNVPVTTSGNILDWDTVRTTVLMDIRDELKNMVLELQKLNSLFHCPNAVDIPNILRRIDGNTKKKSKATTKTK